MSKIALFASVAAAAGMTWTCVPKSDVVPIADTPSKVQQNQIKNVTRYFNDTCAPCHGENLQGGGGGTKPLVTREKFDQSNDRHMYNAIRNGIPHTGMVPFKDALTDADAWALVVHMREVQARGLRNPEADRKAIGKTYQSQRAGFKIEDVATSGFSTPWAIDWLPDGRALVTNKPGSISVLRNGASVGSIAGLPKTVEIGQGGLMDVAVHPDYAKNGWIYLSFTDPGERGGGQTKIVRGKLTWTGDNAQWTGQQTIYQAPQSSYTGAGIHFGSRIAFDGKGHVYFNIGERGTNMGAQKLSTPDGKIFRVKEDGTVPADNPFVKTKDAIGAIWSYGHRNPQGLVVLPDGSLVDTEHAPKGGDEVNVIKKGGNYGWPVICFGINYSDSPFVTPWPTAQQKMEIPVFRWIPSTGACGLTVVSGSAFPNWSGDLLAGGLSGANVDRIRVKGGKFVEREEILWGMGRVRDVACGPDGNIYVVLNGPDKIIRLVPSK